MSEVCLAKWCSIWRIPCSTSISDTQWSSSSIWWGMTAVPHYCSKLEPEAMVMIMTHNSRRRRSLSSPTKVMVQLLMVGYEGQMMVGEAAELSCRYCYISNGRCVLRITKSSAWLCISRQYRCLAHTGEYFPISSPLHPLARSSLLTQPIWWEKKDASTTPPEGQRWCSNGFSNQLQFQWLISPYWQSVSVWLGIDQCWNLISWWCD